MTWPRAGVAAYLSALLVLLVLLVRGAWLWLVEMGGELREWYEERGDPFDAIPRGTYMEPPYDWKTEGDFPD